MIIDFTKLGGENTADTVLSPREIFNALPNKNDKFQYPRDVQSQVWSYWFARRDEPDLVLKMNTGSGKTIVGLLILKSCLNENKGPAVYIAPDNYLIKQIMAEAKDLGIEVTQEVNSPRFLSGKAILIANIYKLVNGLSVFGVGDEGIKIGIGTLLVDDAHACLDTIEDQFTINITPDCEAFEPLFALFKNSLAGQCRSKAIEIEVGDPTSYMQVPFWDFQQQNTDVAKILIKNKENDSIKFVWPLIKESLLLCRCVISSRKIEISPHCIPIHMIPSITSAQRRIFMTATLVDDSILSSHFGVVEDSILRAIVPDTAGDMGDRMILMPQVLNTGLTDDQMKYFCAAASKQINVVVIVPSDYRANYWADVADVTLKKENIYDGVANLKKEHVGLVIMVNRYDGIDLPKNACRLLVIDGLPDVRRQIDKINQSILLDSDRIIGQIIQKIEQGMGRGVRSNDDYCVVFLMGKDLANQLYAKKAIDRFSPGTKAQFFLSEKLSEQIKGKGPKELLGVIKYCLDREKNWVKTSKGVMATLTYDANSTIDKVAISQRKAFDAALQSNYGKSVEELNLIVNETENKHLKAYLKQCMAEYVNLYDPPEAQKILMSAAADNTRVLKPLRGITYHKLDASGTDQAKLCSEFLMNRHDDPNKLIIETNGILESLVFKPDTANKFEEAFKMIARFMGFNSQRPENEYSKGPDVLWAVGDLEFFVIECKNGSITDKINKHDCNQLNGSVHWFTSKYDNTCKLVPIIVHLSTTFEYAATPHKDTRIIDSDRLEKFKENLKGFITSLCVGNKYHNISFVRDRLIHFSLRPNDFLQHFTAPFKSS